MTKATHVLIYIQIFRSLYYLHTVAKTKKKCQKFHFNLTLNFCLADRLTETFPSETTVAKSVVVTRLQISALSGLTHFIN